MDSDSSAGVQGAPRAGGSILKGNTMGSDTSQGTPTNLNELPKHPHLSQPDHAPLLFFTQSGMNCGHLCPWLWVPASPQGHPCLPSPAAESRHP